MNCTKKRSARRLRRTVAPAILGAIAACGTDGLPGEGTPTQAAAQETRVGRNSPPLPKSLRAAYIASAQEKASDRYHGAAVAPGLVHAENPAQRFGVALDPSGVSLASDDGAWTFRMEPAALGCEGRMTEVNAAEPEAEGNRTRYLRGGLQEWYVNGPLGLEQGFVVASAPPCDGDKIVAIAVETELGARLVDEDGDGRGDSIEFAGATGKPTLRYTDLFVRDAEGKALPAWLSMNAGRLDIHFDDAQAAYPVEIDPLVWTQQSKLLASDGAAGDVFGTTIAISGDTALVGAHADDELGADSGSAFVFVRSGEVWTEQAKLVPSDGAAGDHFGVSVALEGDTAVVGAYLHDGIAGDAGAAYVFVRNAGVWSQEAKLMPGDAGGGERFGISVALSGNTALAGAYWDGVLGNQDGSAYVFVRDMGVWTQQAKLSSSTGQSFDDFGIRVALDGDLALVAAHVDDDNGVDSGSVYAFSRNNGVWSEEAKIKPSDGAAADQFGAGLALSGNTALVGCYGDDELGSASGSAYVFVRNAGAWSQEAKIVPPDGATNDFFGYSVALLGDAALIGAYGSDDKALNGGSAYLYTRSGGVWSQTAKVYANDPVLGDSFGAAVALTATTLFVGANATDDKGVNAGAAYSFVLKAATGDSCMTAVECVTGFCVDGVCCESACGGGAADDCQVCSAAAGSPANGTCAPRAAGSTCRSSAGACDTPELCDGTATACPGDVKAVAGTMCRSSAGVCDPAESCDGMSNTCPPDAKLPSNATCRPSMDTCDAEEKCDGMSDACPPNVGSAAGTVCRAATGDCDMAETCDGMSLTCPPDVMVAGGTECRAAAGACDVAESCDGTTADCPPDARAATGTQCRGPAGDCDKAETCDGMDANCPADVKAAAGTECRAKAGECDVAESCDGKADACPSDDSAADGTECSAGQCSAGACRSTPTPPPPTGPGGGCTCSTPGEPGESRDRAWLALVGAGLLLSRRKRGHARRRG